MGRVKRHPLWLRILLSLTLLFIGITVILYSTSFDKKYIAVAAVIALVFQAIYFHICFRRWSTYWVDSLWLPFWVIIPAILSHFGMDGYYPPDAETPLYIVSGNCILAYGIFLASFHDFCNFIEKLWDNYRDYKMRGL